jgi:hypothetical protein
VAHELVQTACIVECFHLFYGPGDICFKVGGYAIYYKTQTSTDTGKNRILCATSDDMFQIFGSIFRFWVAMELPCEICTAKMPPRGELVEIGGRCFLGSVSILFDTAVQETHWIGPGIWLGLLYERVQYRLLRIALGLMGSTPNNCLCVLDGIPPLAERFAYLKFRYLVAAFYRLGHPLRERLGVLGALNMGRCIRGYSDVLSFDIVPAKSFRRHELPALLGTPLVDEHMEKKLANIQGAMYSLVALRELLTVTSGYGASCIFYTDGSLIKGCAGFAVHQMGVGGFGHKIASPAGVFTAELSALFTAMRHIAEVIRPP